MNYYNREPSGFSFYDKITIIYGGDSLLLQGECFGCGRNSWLIDYLCPECIRKKREQEEKRLLNEGKMSKGGLNERPEGERPPAPPKQVIRSKYDEAIYAIEMRKRYWQEKLRVAKFKDEKNIMSITEQKINELDLAIEKLH